MANESPTDIRGTIYPSQRVAAEALGVTPAAINYALRTGTTDTVGLRGGYQVRLDGVPYNSQKALCLAHDLNISHTNTKIREARKQGRKSVVLRVGLLEWD